MFATIYLFGFVICWCCCEFQCTVDKKKPNKKDFLKKSLWWPFTLVWNVCLRIANRKKHTPYDTVLNMALWTNDEEVIGSIIALAWKSAQITEHQAETMSFQMGIDWTTWKDVV